MSVLLQLKYTTLVLHIVSEYDDGYMYTEHTHIPKPFWGHWIDWATKREALEKRTFSQGTVRVENALVITSSYLRNQGQHGIIYENERNSMPQTVTARKSRAAQWGSSISIHHTGKDEDECNRKKKKADYNWQHYLFLFILKQAFSNEDIEQYHEHDA